MTAKALICDFDGLILDTESSEYETWKAIYARYGQVLPLDEWQAVIGLGGEDWPGPCGKLQKLVDETLNCKVLESEAMEAQRTIWDSLAVEPGVEAHLDAAQAAGLKLAIASSSPRWWVEPHLKRLGLLDRFEVVKTADDVEKTKPDPELYVAAAEALGISPQEAIVYEDSPNGALAGVRAGAFVVAVPGPMTRGLPFEGIAMNLNSLAEVSLATVLQTYSGWSG